MKMQPRQQPAKKPARGPAPLRAIVLRAAVLLLPWVFLMGVKPGDLAMGVLTALAAGWLSVRLLPPGMLGLRIGPALALAPRFLWQSVVAGFDVARRAFDPRLPVRPGLVTYRTQLPPGARRNAFTAYTSLLPGTVPCGSDDDGIVYHCLDVSQPVAEDLAREEQRLARVFTDPPAAREPGDA